MLGGFQVFVSGVALVAVTLAGATTAAAQTPAPAEPTKPVLLLDGGQVALITILIKPGKEADFELVLSKLKEALAKSDKPERKPQAASWKIFKGVAPAKTPDGTANSVYLMRIDPIVKDAEYDIMRIIAEVFPVEAQEIFTKYKEAFGGRAITYLNPFMEMQ